MADTTHPRKGGRKSQPAVTMASPVALAAAMPEPTAIGVASVVAEQPAAPTSEPATPEPTPPGAAPETAAAPDPVREPETHTATPSAAAEPIKEGQTDMATTYETTAPATDKAKAMFGEMNERAKSAMEKSVKLGEEMTEFTKGNVEALVTSGRVAAKGAETMAQDIAETMKKHFESASAQMKSFTAVKSPTELFQLQSDYARSAFDAAVADASKFSESWMKLAGDIAQPLSSRYAIAAEKIKGGVSI